MSVSAKKIDQQEYYRKEWLTKGEFIKKMRKLNEKRAGFAKKYLTKYSKFKNFGGETSPEQENYAWDAAIIVSSWSIINSPLPIKELVTLSGIISVVAKRIRNSLRLLSEKKKEREIQSLSIYFFLFKAYNWELSLIIR